MNAEILTIGDELLIGQVVNTNASWLGEQLDLLGVDVLRSVTLGDDVPAIQEALAQAYPRAELIICTGGLGPTHDDVTREAVAAFYGRELVFEEDVFEAVKARFTRRGRRIPESNRAQAMVPRGFEVLPNPRGTAPGLWYVDRDREQEHLLAVLPGVPHEMEYLVREEVLPRLRAHKGLRVILHRTLLTTGIGESDLQERIGDLSGFLGPALRLAYLPTSSGVRLRLSAYGEDRADAAVRLQGLEDYLRARIERYVFGTDEETLEAVVGRMLQERGLTLSVAESCTGGFVLNRLTNVSGSSAYVIGGIVAYCNEVKQQMLGVDAEVLAREGAVSEEVARQMARGVRHRLGTDLGISTTGIAGPSGGTPEKPVGTVWVGLADADGDYALHLQLAEERILNKEFSSTAVLGLIRKHLITSVVRSPKSEEEGRSSGVRQAL